MSGSRTFELWSVSKSEWMPWLSLASSVLSDEERDRASRFHFDRDRDLFIVSHAAVRVLLSRWTGLAPHALQFERGDFGKPRLVSDDRSLHFNLSHSSDLALIGISDGGEIGVDVEKISAERGLEDLVSSHFSSGERMVLDGLEGGEWVDCFYRVWTLKEAYLKAEGVGLIDALSGIEFDLIDPGRAPIVKSPLNGFIPGRWEARSLSVSSGYAAAMVIDGGIENVVVKRLVPSEVDFQG